METVGKDAKKNLEQLTKEDYQKALSEIQGALCGMRGRSHHSRRLP